MHASSYLAAAAVADLLTDDRIATAWDRPSAHRLAVRRHGPLAVLRALSRAERAPATIAAI